MGSQVAEGHEKSLAENLNITRHYIILTSILYQVRALTSHNTEESENSPDSPHLGEIERMHKQCVPGAPPFFVCGGDIATCDSELFLFIKLESIVVIVTNPMFIMLWLHEAIIYHVKSG